MADFGSGFINALTAGQHQRLVGQQIDQYERRKTLAPEVQSAIGGDATALGRIAAVDPDYAMKIGPILETMDAKKRAEAKAGADYTYSAANAMLQATPADRPALYKTLIAQGKAQNLKLDHLPQDYTPQMEPWLRNMRQMAIPILEQWKAEQDRPQPMGGGAPGGGGGGGQYGGAIAGIESAGGPNNGYGALGPVANAQGDRAYGKYQVMGANIGPWTKEILGKEMTPQEFLANPDAQNKVFEGKFGQYVTQYGSPQAASRAWFAGPGGMNNPNARDVNGMTVANYEQKFNGAMGGQPAQMPNAPAGLVPSTPAAPMPGAPAGLTPPGPPPAQMPSPAMAGTQPVTQGDAQPAQPPAATWQTEFNDMRRHIPQGWQALGTKKHGPAYDSQGRLRIINSQTGEETSIEIPKKENAWEDVRNPGGQIVGQRNKVTNEFKPIAETGEKPPAGYRKAEGGGLEFIPGGPADPSITKKSAPMNNEQARDAGFADRMQNSAGILEPLDTQGTKFWERLAERAQGNSGTSYGMTPEFQKFRQAKDDFINSQLRRESGAAISADEYKKADRQYFPQPGDSKDVIAQKSLNRKLAVEAMIRGAGPTYKPSESVGSSPPSAPAPAPAEAPPAAPPSAGRAGLSMPRLSPEEAAKLAPGTPFIGQDGIPRTRK